MSAQKFSGLNDVEEFVDQFDAISVISKWADDQKRYAIATYLEGPALQLYKTNFSTYKTYAEIVVKLKKQFPPQIDYAQQILLYTPNEPIITYFYSLDNLAVRAKIPDDRFTKHFIKSVLKDYQWMLASRIYASKEELRKTILQTEDVFGQESNIRPQGIELPLRLPTEHSHDWHAQGDPLALCGPVSPPSDYRTPQASEAVVGVEVTPHPRYNLRPRQMYSQTQRGESYAVFPGYGQYQGAGACSHEEQLHTPRARYNLRPI